MRKHYLDNIRWITVVIVVFYHVIYMYNGVQPFGVIGAFKEVQYQDAFQYLTFPWFMALLFTVAGMSARYYLECHTDKEFIRSKNIKLLIPSTLGIFLFWWTLGYYNMAIGGAFETMAIPDTVPAPVKSVIMYFIMSLSGIGVLWFIQVLWIFSILLILVRKIEKDRLYNIGVKANVLFIIACTLFAFVMAQILNAPVVTVYRFGIYGFCYFMGYFVFSHEEVMARLDKYKVYFLVAAVISGIAYTVVYFGENYALEPVNSCPLAIIFCWLSVVAILLCMRAWFDYETPFSKWMNSKSWGLYIFHYLPLAMAAYYLNLFAPAMPAVICYVLVTVSAFAGGYILYEIISRIPVLKFFVLGITGRKEKKQEMQES